MRVLFDASTPPRLAAALHAHLSARGGSAAHAADLGGGRPAPDLAWVGHARALGRDGLVVTGDVRLHRVRALRLAFRRAGLRGLALSAAFQLLPADRQAALLVERWTEVEEAVAPAAGPALFEMPAARFAALRVLPA